MTKELKHFIARITGLSFAIVLISWLVFSLFIPEYYLSVFPWLLGFFMVTAICVHAYQLRLAKKDLARFTRSNMLVTFFKLVLYSAFSIVYIANDTENALVFVIALFLLYLIFSIFEVSEISRIARLK